MGASALSSMEEPEINAPAAMITSQSYPGIAHGSGVTWLSTGAAAWMPLQNSITCSGWLKTTAWIISWRLSVALGTHSKPSFS